MNAFLKLNKSMMRMPLGWRLWLGFLITLNVVVPSAYLGRPEAQLTIAAVILSFVLMTILTHFKGFTRLLGLGHIFWIPLLLILWTRLPDIPTDGFYGIWIRVLMAANAVSLAIDAIDVVRFLAGDRAETISLA